MPGAEGDVASIVMFVNAVATAVIAQLKGITGLEF